jgi:hypothetical protein
MDPYLESQGVWPDFHAGLITYCRDALNDALPDHYVAQIDERVRLVDLSGEAGVGLLPDGAVILPLAKKDLEEVRETSVEIRRLPDRELVTAIEVLSPTNKVGRGRAEYLDEREQLIDEPVNLVEIDLLIGGGRLPMGHPLPRGDYHAIVLRADRRPHGEVYSWTIRDPLPALPIPLRAPDPDILLDLAALFAAAYRGGRYARSINYAAPLALRLAAEDRAWAEARARAVARPAGGG